MDFMNLNQAAHGDREFGFICTPAAPEPQGGGRPLAGRGGPRPARRLDARGLRLGGDAQGLKVARFGDNMREVAVTEGDKVAAQLQFGYSVNGYGVGDLVAVINEVTDAEVDAARRASTAMAYEVTASDAQQANRARAGPDRARACAPSSRRAASRPSPTTFEDLHGLAQLPGLAVQRLMADGYGFGAEGDWKTAALVRAMKVMASGLAGRHVLHGGLHLPPRPEGPEGAGRPHAGGLPLDRRRQALARGPPAGHRRQGRPRPAGLQRRARARGLNASLDRHGQPLPPDRQRGGRGRPRTRRCPKLPVARAVWVPRPDLKVAAAAWIHAGGAHHTAFSQAVRPEHLEDFAEMAGDRVSC